MALKLSAPPPVNSERFGDWLSDFYRQVKAELGVTIDTTESLTPTQATDLTDGGDSTLHYHAEDRKRSNHTGTQTSQTISDFESRVRSLSTGTDHSQLFSLAWTQSGHTGTATTIGGFNASGVAEYLTRSGTGTVVALATSATLTTPTINTVASVGGAWTAAATWTLPALTLGGTVTSNGQSFSGTIANLGTVTTADINGGTVDGAVIGGASAAAGTFTTVSATTGNITTVNATTVDTTNLEVTTLKAKDGTAAGSIADTTGVVTLASSVLTTTDINGGTIDGAALGGAAAVSLGTPSSGTLTNCTGLPISTGVAGLGANVATFLATPSSANLASALTDETGSGAAVFANTPTLVTPVLGAATATSITLANTTFASQVGILYKGASRFVHDFNYGNNGTVTTNGNNTFVGVGAGNFTMGSTAVASYQASGNTGVGINTLSANTTGYNNTALGTGTLPGNTTGHSNTAFGTNVLSANTSGYQNNAIGTGALYSNTTGYINNAMGMDALTANTQGYGNSAVGTSALAGTTLGYYNTAIGYAAGRYIADGSTHNTSGTNSIFIGTETKAGADSQANQIVIGYAATGAGANSVVIGHTSITVQHLRGAVYTQRPVTAVATGSNRDITTAEVRAAFTNEGATARQDFTLPTAVANLEYQFVVQDTDGIRVIANTGDTIRIAASVSASAGRIDSTTIGDSVTLLAVNATEWVATSLVGAGWTAT